MFAIQSADLSPSERRRNFNNYLTIPDEISTHGVELVDAGSLCKGNLLSQRRQTIGIYLVWEKIVELKAAVCTAFYPNTIAVINQLADGSGGSYALHNNSLTIPSLESNKPSHDYFIAKFDGNWNQLFKAARYLYSIGADIDDLKSFPCLNDDSIIHVLKTELVICKSWRCFENQSVGKAQKELPT